MQSIQPIDNPSVDTINSVVQQNLRRVIEWSAPVEAVATTAGASVTVRHNLGTVPSFIDVKPSQDSRWWIADDDRKLWTSKAISFSASAPGRYTVSVGRM